MLADFLNLLLALNIWHIWKISGLALSGPDQNISGLAFIGL
jgi:hypothetical protein